LYAVSMARISPSPDQRWRDRVADRIVGLLDNASTSGMFGTSWVTRFAVEAFRSLAELSPALATGPVCRHLTRFDGHEVTAILEAVLTAARNLGLTAHHSSEIRATAQALWSHYSQRVDGAFIVNEAGILARILELKGRCN